MANTREKKGVSLAKGPVALVGLVLLAYGVTALIFGGHSFTTHAVAGTVNGKTWLGLEVNAWSSLLFIGAGALLLFGSPAHWGAKSMALIVGLALAAASLIALYDKTDVFGIFAANGMTKLVWGAAGGLLILLALLPRVGRRERIEESPEGVVERPVRPERVRREPQRERGVEGEPAARSERAREGAGSRRATR